MKALHILIMCLAFMQATAQQTDVCKSDSVVIIRPGEGTVQIARRDCRLALISETTYQDLVLASIYSDSLKAASATYMQAVKLEASTTDSLIQAYLQEIRLTDQALDDCRALATDAIRNTRKAKFRGFLRATGAAMAGFGAGFISRLFMP